MTIAIYPGSFDPITLGHLDVIQRASRMFDTVIMAVVRNTSKDPLLTVEERVTLIKDCVTPLNNVSVESFEGLTVDLAKKRGAKIIIRGLRAVSDFEYEFMMSQMNKNLNPDIETLFIPAGLEYQFLNSSVVKEVARLGGDISKTVPPQIQQFLAKKFLQKKSAKQS